ncbi:hypothetical protein R70331_25485 [Paenibacillus sp. FSL R7-0331]|nr:hypothetical protein R70331_25485 [Paenibacillus sp. FSL R7-0331]
MISDDEVLDVIGVWEDILRDIPNEDVMQAARRLCRENNSFAPTPGEIYQACIQSGKEMTVYQIQQQEQELRMLELQEYHETEKVGPMPDHVREKLDAIFKKARVTEDES